MIDSTLIAELDSADGPPDANALRLSEARYRALVEATDLAVWSWSADGASSEIARTVRWWEDLTGQSAAAASISPTAWLDVVHPDDRHSVGEAWHHAITNGFRYDVAFRVRARSGVWRHVHARGVPVHNADGTVREWVGVLNDVTDRRRAETELDKSEARLARLASAGIIGIIRWDLDRSLILDANDEFLRMTGYDRNDLAAGLNFRTMTPPEWTSRNEEGVRDLRETGVGGSYEKEYFRKDGSRVPVIIVGVRFEDATNEGMSFVLDITERKHAEQVLREADRKKDEFIALLAHELRNPLAPIRTGLQVVRLSNDRAIREQTQAMMERQLGHMVRLIDDLLDISRISRNKMELRRSRVTLSDVIETAVETARPAIDASRHDLAITLPSQPVCLDADLTRLAQVFSNLLTNSAKYTENGGQIRLAAECRGHEVLVTVTDNGIGIPAEALPNIFDMFSQVDRSVERQSGGLGIGLALVKGLVEMHGGAVAARSDGPHQGSTFSVTLPVRLPDPVATITDPEPETSLSSSLRGRRILVVDDNRDGADSLAMMLRYLGNDIQTAYDGQQAVEYATTFEPDIILMDLGMPNLNGLEATRRIREGSGGGNVTIIALTGWSQEADRERTYSAGCDGHLVKPVQLSELTQLLERLRGRK